MGRNVASFSPSLLQSKFTIYYQLVSCYWVKCCMSVAVKHGGDLTSGQGHCVQQALLLGETVHSLLDVILDLGYLGDLDPATQQKVAGIAGLTRPSLDMVCNFHGFIKFQSTTFEATDPSCPLLLALIGFLGSN